MKCTYITRFFDKKSHELFLCHLGERAGISSGEMQYIELTDFSPISQEVWDVVNSSEKVIIDLTRISTEMLIILYARYLKWPIRTFLLISAKQENEFRWGYGAGIYEPLKRDNINLRRLTRLQRDIAFYFGQDEMRSTEPVREFLEKYWNKELIKKIECNVDEIDFDNIEIRERNTGEEITRRLKKCLAKKDLYSFQNELRNIADNKYIDPMDYIIIGRLCGEVGLVSYRVAVLEKGAKVWKGKNQPLMFELIDAYIDSPNREYRERALKLVEEYFHVEYDDLGRLVWKVEDIKGKITQDYIKTLFNAYISLNEYKKLYALAEYEDIITNKTKDDRMHVLFLRNKAISLGELGEYLEALKLYSKLFEESQNESTLNLMVSVCEKANKLDIMLKLLTALIWFNFGDVGYMTKMADIMINYSIFYNARDGWQKTIQLAKTAEKQAVPLLMYVFSFEENQKREFVYDVDRILRRVDGKSENYFLGNKDKIAYLWIDFKRKYGSIYDFTLVDYLKDQYDEIQGEESKMKKYLEDTIKELRQES